MEGLSGWMVLAILACYGFAGVSLVLALVALGFLLARRRRHALITLAAALLALATGSAFFPLALTGERSDGGRLMVAFAASLALAGIGQFVAALRNPRSYPAALICSVSASAFVAHPLMTHGYGTWLRGLLIAGPSFLLALTSLAIAIRRYEWPRPWKPMLPALILVNLTVLLLAIVNFGTRDSIIHVDEPEVFVLKEQLSDLTTNTRWRPVFVALAVSTTLSAAPFLIGSVRRK